MVVVDTSVLIDLLRGVSTAGADQLRRLEREGAAFVIPAICAQEVLQGARDKPEWKRLLAVLETQRMLVPEDAWRTHAAAARIFFDSRRRGITIRSTVDCIVAAQVLEVDGTLLHADADYERMKKVCALRTWTA